MPEKEVAIEIKDVRKEFMLPQNKNTTLKQAVVNMVRKNNKTIYNVLDGVNFNIYKGDFFGIVGRNGSGKSTLLKLIAGVYEPTKGNIYVHGGLTPFIELGVGFNPELSGRDNVYLNGALLGFSHAQVDGMYDDIVEFAELAPFMDQKLKNYSSGMQVRLAFSIAIKAKSDILIFDEVLAVGDEAFQRKCTEYFRELNNNNTTVVLVTHDMGSVKKFCNRALFLDEGKIKLIGLPSEVADAYSDANVILESDDDSLKINNNGDDGTNFISSHAEIIGVKISNSQGIASSSCKYNEVIDITIEYKLKRDIDKGAIDIGLTLGYGGPLYFYTDSRKRLDLIKGRAGDIITANCRVKNIFNDGVFYVVSSLFDVDTSEVYARNRKLKKLIINKFPSHGYVYPEHEFTINNKTQNI